MPKDYTPDEYYNKYKKLALKTLASKFHDQETALFMIKRLYEDEELNSEATTLKHLKNVLSDNQESLTQMGLGFEESEKTNERLRQNIQDIEAEKETLNEKIKEINNLLKTKEEENYHLKNINERLRQSLQNVEEEKETLVKKIQEINNLLKSKEETIQELLKQKHYFPPPIPTYPTPTAPSYPNPVTPQPQALPVPDNPPYKQQNQDLAYTIQPTTIPCIQTPYTTYTNPPQFLQAQTNTNTPSGNSSSETRKFTSVMETFVDQNEAKNITPFHGVQGEKGLPDAAQKFLKFQRQLQNYQATQSASDERMLKLMTSKLKGDAEKLIDLKRPSTYSEAIELFRNRYIKQEFVVSLMTNFPSINRELDESVQAFNLRVHCAIQLIEDLTGHPPPFHEIEKVLLRPYDDEMINYHNIKEASSKQDVMELTRQIEDFHIRKPSLLKNIKGNRIMTTNEGEYQPRCIHCGSNTHFSRYCPNSRYRNAPQNAPRPYRVSQNTSIPSPNHQPFRG